MNKKIFLPLASLFFCAILYLLWPLAHTIALRKLLLLICAVIGVVLWIRSGDRYEILKSPWLIFLGLLLAWVVFHAGFISQNGSEAWRELRGQWMPAYFAVLAGIGLALAGRSIDPSVFRIYLLVILVIQPVLFLLISIYKSIHIGHLDTEFHIGMLGTDLKPSLTFSSDMLAALACSKILTSNKVGGHKYLWLIPIALAMLVAFFSSSLNSMLLIGSCILLMASLLIYQLKNRILRGQISVLILIAVVLVYFSSFIPFAKSGWSRLIINSKIAINIDEYTNWTNYQKLGYPHNEMGEQVPQSFYMRVAYATAGFQAVLEHPWGYGVTRHAFERLIQQKFPDANIPNTHNGYLNLSCAVGIPGLLLFLLAIVAILWQLKKSSSEMAHPAVWMIGINLFHWILDPLERDHFFESYLFLIGLLLTLSINKVRRPIGAKIPQQC